MDFRYAAESFPLLFYVWQKLDREHSMGGKKEALVPSTSLLPSDTATDTTAPDLLPCPSREDNGVEHVYPDIWKRMAVGYVFALLCIDNALHFVEL